MALVLLCSHSESLVNLCKPLEVARGLVTISGGDCGRWDVLDLGL